MERLKQWLLAVVVVRYTTKNYTHIYKINSGLVERPLNRKLFNFYGVGLIKPTINC